MVSKFVAFLNSKPVIRLLSIVLALMLGSVVYMFFDAVIRLHRIKKTLDSISTNLEREHERIYQIKTI